MHRFRRALLVSVPLLAILIGLSGCSTTIVKTRIFDQNRVEVLLRGQVKNGEPVDRGFQHPVQISQERLITILASIQVRQKRESFDQRYELFAPRLVPDIAEGLSKAFAAADPSEEIAVMAVHKHYSLGVFTRKSLTSFVSYIEDDNIYLLFSRVDWTVGRRANKGGSVVRIPEPDPTEQVMKFRLVTAEPLEMVGKQGVRTAWRDPQWGPLPVSAPAAPDPDVLERERETVAVEEQVVDDDEKVAGTAGATTSGAAATKPDREPLPYPTTPTGLRALADLEEARAAGEVSEAEYVKQRRALADQ